MENMLQHVQNQTVALMDIAVETVTVIVAVACSARQHRSALLFGMHAASLARSGSSISPVEVPHFLHIIFK